MDDAPSKADCLHCSYLNGRVYKMCADCFAAWVEKVEEEAERTRDSERLTAADYNVRINCVAD